MNKLMLIDGNSLLFRAYFAMRDMVTREGVHTQGVFAFISMLNKLLQDEQPDYIAVAFDMNGKTFRHEMYPEYKAGRLKTPIELLQQVPLMHRVLEAMNIAVLEIEGYEADDIIGTVSNKASNEGFDVLIVTGDKDELQLVNDKTRVMINKKGVSEFDLFDRSKMIERYEITPEQFIDLKGLMGDKSDNIPGIPGIGEKKGIALLKQFGSVEGVVDNAGSIPGKTGETIRENTKAALMSKTLATIEVNAPVIFSFDDLKLTEPDYDKLISVYKGLEFNGFIKKLKAEGSREIAVLVEDAGFEKGLSKIKNVEASEFLKTVPAGSEVSVELITDDNHLALPAITGIGMLSAEMKLFSFMPLMGLTAYSFLSAFSEKDYKLIGFDLKKYVYSMLAHGIDRFIIKHDVMVSEYLIDPNRSRYEISKMLLRYCNCTWKDPDNKEDEIKRNLYAVAIVSARQDEAMEQAELTKLFETCEMPLIETLSSMEIEGIRLDRDALIENGKELEVKISALEKSIHERAGKDFNINSPKQLGKILFDEMKLPYPNPIKGNSSYSTSVDVLEKIFDENPVIREILDFRKYSKLKNTYVEGLLPLLADDGKIHPHFQQTVAATGRLSCTEPNLQNIPMRDEYGRGIRKAFVVDGKDRTFVGADYSQIELRIMAALSGDEVMIEAFNRGEDIHRITASRVFNIPADKVTAADRTKAKAVNFGVIYGISGFGLSESLHITRKEGQKYIDDYFKKHTAVKEYLDRQIEEGESKKEVRTLFGRIRQIPEFSSRRYADRQLAQRLAMNTPIQGGAADIIKIAMNKVYSELKARNFRSKLILQIHDELIIEAYDDEIEDVKELLKRNMEGAADLSVELLCEMNTADNWYDLK